MYKMDINVLGYKLNVEILILIGVIYLIMVLHTVGGCCNIPAIIEGVETMTNSMKKTMKKTN